jgi:iron complex outermembrane receptor protein
MLSGFVFDESSLSPLPDANVYITQLKLGTTTTSDGKFVLTDIPGGNYTLSVSFLGYKKSEQRIAVHSGTNPEIKIYLKSQAYANKEVVINATREGEKEEIPYRINSISLQAIEQAPVTNVPAMLDFIPGVNLSNTFGIYSSKAVIAVRGLPANNQSRTLVLLDGVPLNKADEGSVNWNMLNKNNIESIRVIKGPGPAQYGSSAMGGVIDITLKKPSKKFGCSVIAGYGTYNTFEGNLDLSGKASDSSAIKGLYWNLSGFGRKSDGYITEPDAYYEAWDTILVPTFLREINTSAKLGYDFKNKNCLEVKLDYFDDKRGNGVKVFENFGAFSEHDTYSIAGKYNGKRKNLVWSLGFFYRHENYQRMYEYLKEGEYQLYEADSKRKDSGGKAVLAYHGFGNHRPEAGFEIKYGSVDGRDTYYTSTDIIYNAGNMLTAAAFAEDEISLMKSKIHISPGLRFDLAQYSGGLFAIDYPSYSIEFYENFEDTQMPERTWNSFCPRLSADYLFAGKNRIYVSFAKGFRVPILDDMTRTGKRKGTFKVANPDLKPEKLTSFECGTDVYVFKKIELSASAYYSIGKDFMYYSSTGDSVNMGYKIVPVLKMKNVGKVEIYGLEGEIKYDLSENFSAFVNYTFTHAVVKENVINDPQVDYDLRGKYLTDVPDHKVSAGFTWKSRFVSATIRYKYIGRQWINDLNVVDEDYLLTDRYPAYSVVSLRLERRILKSLKGAMNVENLFDRKYTDGNAQQCPGRFVMVSLTFAF